MTKAMLMANKGTSPEAGAGAKAAYGALDEIERLVRAFEAGSLPKSEWTHRAHMTVALWYLVHCPGEEAIRRIRVGIKRYNEAVNVENSRTGGYHETLTVFWVWVVGKYFLLEADARSTVDIVNGCIDRHGDKDLPLRYYSRDVLMSWRARASWVEPDLRPLD
jgi:hypothetical protein